MNMKRKLYFETDEYKKMYPMLSKILKDVKKAKEKNHKILIIDGIYIELKRFE